MAEENADWSSEANSAIHISLVAPSPGGAVTLHTFNPTTSYAIFEEESIFGYKGLKINLKYNACDMRPGLQILYSKKFKTVGDTEPTDLKAIFEEILPKNAFEKTTVFDSAIADPSLASWTPPGELWQSFEIEDHSYEIWKGSLADLSVLQMLKRIQVLLLFFIEGATFINVENPEEPLGRWTVFFLYQKKTANITPNTSPYTFMGYSTVFRFFNYQPNSSPSRLTKKSQTAYSLEANLEFELSEKAVPFSDLPCRSRISQFLILPPFQKGGHGSRLYNSIYDFYHQEPQTIEITVEDPNEHFDDMRDKNDLIRLRKIPEFAALRINTEIVPRSKGNVPSKIVDFAATEKIRKQAKMAPRQFYRVTEIQLLSYIPPHIRQSLLIERPTGTVDDSKAKTHEYRLWKLWTKQRLYRHNRDTLAQLDRTERIDKLEEALGGVEAQYAGLLRSVDEKEEKTAGGNATGKRPALDEEQGQPLAKRVKTG